MTTEALEKDITPVKDIAPPAPIEQPAIAFDEAVLAEVVAAIAPIVKKHPELKSAVVVFGWQARLAQNLAPCAWLNAEGLVQVAHVADSINMSQQLLKANDVLHNILNNTHQGFLQQFIQLSQHLEQTRAMAQQEAQAAQEKRSEQEAAQSTQGGDAGPPAAVAETDAP